MWKAFVNAGKTSNASDPELPAYATGDALKAITSALAKDHDSGVISKGTVTNKPVVTSAKPATDPSEVDVRDCADATSWLRYRVSGGLADNEPGGRHLVTAVVQDVGGWRVSTFAAQGVGTC
jgi:hypothetical protein